jgi:hypothetical protein
MGSELSRADLLDHSLSDQEYFEKFFLLFSDKIDSYRDYDISVYQYTMRNLDLLLALSRKTRDSSFVKECSDTQGEYYTTEILSRILDLSDLIEWLAKEYAVLPCSTIPLCLQHPVFFVEPPLEIILKNMERIVRWYKRYSTILLCVDQYPQGFTEKFFFSCCCDSLAEKVKMIY